MSDRVLVIGASGGIGSAIADLHADRGDAVTRLSRREDGFDLTDDDGVRAALEGLEGPFERIVVATGALQIDGAEPEKTIKAITAKAMRDQFAVNAIGPALVLRHVPDLVPRKGRSVVAVLSARVGSIGDNGIGGWVSYRSAKAAVNQVVHTAAIELARTRRDCICVALHPGTVATDFTADYQDRHSTVSPGEAAENLARVMDGLTADDTGGFFDYAGKAIPW